MLKTASIILSIWGVINFFLAALILAIIIFFKRNAPLLVMVFDKSEITKFDDRMISSVNCLAILYNSCAAAISVLALCVIWSNLINGQKWAFWVLMITIGFVQAMAFVAFAGIGNQRLPVNIVLTALYVAGIGLAACSLFNR